MIVPCGAVIELKPSSVTRCKTIDSPPNPLLKYKKGAVDLLLKYALAGGKLMFGTKPLPQRPLSV